MSGIFISYRKEDTRAWAVHLRDRLAREFGERQIFFDVDSIDPGHWRAQIDRALSQCQVLLVLIGPRWLGATQADGRPRLSVPDDVHRHEIATGLTRQGVTVIPLLVDGARRPLRSDLPDELQGLLDRQVREVGDAHDSRTGELRWLTGAIDRLTGRRRFRRRALATLSGVVAVGAVNATVRADSVAAALVFLAAGAGLTLMAWHTYHAMARAQMKGSWIALVAVILSSLMTVGSLIRLR
jgi:hypothetical protein